MYHSSLLFSLAPLRTHTPPNGYLNFSPAHINNKIQKWLAEDWQNLQREGPLSFSSALFSKQFCDLLTEEVLNIKRQCRFAKLVLLFLSVVIASDNPLSKQQHRQ